MSDSTSASAPDPGPEDLFLRPLRGFAPLIWFIGLAAGLALSWEPLLHHLDYVKRFGDLAHYILWVGLGGLIVGLPLYQWIRRRGWWRYELFVLTAWAVAVGLLRDPLATLAVLWILIVCFLAGSYVLDKLHLDVERSTEVLALATAVGMGLLVVVLFVLGLVGAYYRWVFILLFALPCVLWASGLRRLGVLLNGLHQAWGESEELSRPAFGVLVVFAFLLLTVSLSSAFTPTLVYDAKVFHLPSIRYYAAAHALRPVPFMSYSYHPQGAEILQTAVYSLAGQYAAGLMAPAAFLLTLLLLYGIVRRVGARPTTAIGAVIIAGSVPFIHWSGSVLKNDLFVALFQAGALYSLLRVWKEGRANWLKLGAFFVGISFSIKHVAIFGGLALGLLALMEILRRPRPWRGAAVCLSIFVGFGTFFHARTYLSTGSPVFPKSVREAAKQRGPVHGDGLKEGELGRIAYPWSFHFDGRKVFASATDNPSGIFLVLCGSVWLFTRRRYRSMEEGLCWWFCLLYFLYWGWVWGILRYAILPFLLLFALTAVRFLSFLRQAGPIVRSAGYAALVYSCVFSLLVAVMIHEVSFAQLRMLTGQSDQKQYLQTVEAEYRAMDFLRSVAKPEDRFIGVQNCARAHLPPLNDFFCAGLENAALALPRVVEALDRGEWNYLIVPNSWRQRYLEAIPDTYMVEPRHQDPAYSVLALTRRAER